MLCERPHIKIKTKIAEYFFSSKLLKKASKDSSVFTKRLTFFDGCDYIRFSIKNPSYTNPILEWLNCFDAIKIPCGNCIYCQYEHFVEWSTRCWLEAKEHDSNLFVTLTYNDKFLPIDGVSKEELSAFMKALRQHYKKKNGVDGIRFFASGEYGKKDDRPHYHVLLFNCPTFGDEVATQEAMI